MRKILSLLGAMALSTTISTSVIACGGSNHTQFKEKINLDIVNNQTVKTEVNASNFYRNLDSIIPELICIFKSLPLKDGYEIKYYSDEQGTVEVTNDNQNAGDVYFTIKAANDDRNWEGTSKILGLSLIKNHLFFISENNFPLNFKVKSDHKLEYSDLNWNIINACNKFKDIPLKYGYEIKYYSDITLLYDDDVTNDYQNAGDVYFTIKADNDDRNWEGKTVAPLKLVLT